MDKDWTPQPHFITELTAKGQMATLPLCPAGLHTHRKNNEELLYDFRQIKQVNGATLCINYSHQVHTENSFNGEEKEISILTKQGLWLHASYIDD